MPKGSDINPENSSGRQQIVNSGKNSGESAARTDYPHAVYREPQGAMKVAEYSFVAWLNNDIYDKPSYYDMSLPRWKPEMQRLFTSSFVGAYLEKIAEQDKKEGRSSAVKTASLATLQGATVRLTNVVRKANEYVYSLELSDPENFEGVEKTEWVVYFEGASVPDTEAATTTAAYGRAMSGDIVLGYGSSTPQKSVKRPKGSYLRSPK